MRSARHPVNTGRFAPTHPAAPTGSRTAKKRDVLRRSAKRRERFCWPGYRFPRSRFARGREARRLDLRDGGRSGVADHVVACAVEFAERGVGDRAGVDPGQPRRWLKSRFPRLSSARRSAACAIRSKAQIDAAATRGRGSPPPGERPSYGWALGRPWLCSSLEGVNRKGFPCPTFLRPRRPTRERPAAATHHFSPSARRAAPTFPTRRASSFVEPPTARATAFWPRARSWPATPSWWGFWSGR